MIELKNKKIIVNAPAKINLHLEVIGKRKDGYIPAKQMPQSTNFRNLPKCTSRINGKNPPTTLLFYCSEKICRELVLIF